MFKFGLVLTKKGKNWFCLCPFHAERTPSFTMDEKFTFYHCFGCGVSGPANGLNAILKEMNRANRAEWLEERKNPKPKRFSPPLNPMTLKELGDDHEDDIPF